MFNRILVPLDGSPLAERAIPHAGHLARIFGGTVLLLQVLDPAPYHENVSSVEPLNWQIRKAEADLYLKGVAARLREQGIQAEHVMREGRTAENIVDFAQSENVDLLVLTTHGAGGLSRWNTSSVLVKVIEKVYLPVLVVRAYQLPGQTASGAVSTNAGQATAGQAAAGRVEDMDRSAASGGTTAQAQQMAGGGVATFATSVPVTSGEPGVVRYRRVLLPIDSSRRAECALPAGIGLVQGEKALRERQEQQPEENEQKPGAPGAPAPEPETTLFLAAVLQPPDLPIPAPYPDELEQLCEQFMRASRSIVQNYLTDMQARVPVASETRMVENESVSAAIHELVEKEDIDLVVLCAHGKTGRNNWPYGSVARNYIEHGTQPVLVIQDVPRSQVRPTAAEIAAEKNGRR